MGTGKLMTFDMDTKKMRGYFRFLSSGYHKIRKSFREAGFEHIQGSVYLHKAPMTRDEAFIVAADILRNNPWADDCLRELQVADVGKVHHNSLEKIRCLMKAGRVSKKQAAVSQENAQQQPVSDAGQQPGEPQPNFGCSAPLLDMLRNAPRTSRATAPATARTSKRENVNQ